MTRYEEVCADNKVLFGELEALSTKINALEEAGKDRDVILLDRQKDAIKGLIGVNLDKLQEIWDAQALTVRRAKNGKLQTMPTLLEERVILSYKYDPDQTGKILADKHHTTINKVADILTKLLNKQYIGY